MRAQFSRRGISLPLKSHFMQFFNNLSDIINIKQLSPISILSRSLNHKYKPWRPPIFFRPCSQTSQTARTDGTYYYDNRSPFAFILIPSASVLYTTRLRGDCFRGFVEVGGWCVDASCARHLLHVARKFATALHTCCVQSF
jgi:hypothetical protein